MKARKTKSTENKLWGRKLVCTVEGGPLKVNIGKRKSKMFKIWEEFVIFQDQTLFER